MSIEIDWPNLTTGPSGQELADSIRDFIHEKFQQVQLPRFIRSVQVHSFDFGEECPVVELKDISDPLDEFYEDDGDEDEDEEVPEGAEEGQLDPLSPAKAEAQAPLKSSKSRKVSSSATPKPTFIDSRLPNLRSGIATPFLSRSTTPGIGSTSNLGYFHLPLSAGLSGTQTPLAPWNDFQGPPSPLRQHDQHWHHNHHEYADPSSRPSTSHTLPTSPPFTHTQEAPSTTGDRSQDLQTTLHISYSGSLSLSLTAEILLDYPMPSFVGIPLKLQITGLSFDGVALLAYLRQPDKNKVNFCFLGAEDAKALVADDGGLSGAPRGQGDLDGTQDKGKEGKLGDLLREIRVESQIGRQENGKQVLKNVGKVEKFVLEQVQRIFEDEFVWPSFWTFLV
ncbi:hypothetical protein N7G274_007991 [Stereocaulon virgatum]|uniref:Mitochondrial distribution and morphology protein 12 n=1 Tax=Stereocaulon virgatum TaxID=373712 RepID=A0ABR4A7L7_9LECA